MPPLAVLPCLSHPGRKGNCSIDVPLYSAYPVLRRACTRCMGLRSMMWQSQAAVVELATLVAGA